MKYHSHLGKPSQKGCHWKQLWCRRQDSRTEARIWRYGLLFPGQVTQALWSSVLFFVGCSYLKWLEPRILMSTSFFSLEGPSFFRGEWKSVHKSQAVKGTDGVKILSLNWLLERWSLWPIASTGIRKHSRNCNSSVALVYTSYAYFLFVLHSLSLYLWFKFCLITVYVFKIYTSPLNLSLQ